MSVLLYFLIANRTYSRQPELWSKLGRPRLGPFRSGKDTDDWKFLKVAYKFVREMPSARSSDYVLNIYVICSIICNILVVFLLAYSFLFDGMHGFLGRCS
jgi:hypothetical protein